MRTENVVYEKSYKFAVQIVKAYQYLCSDRKEFTLSKQLLRCGTSIGANISEANGAISKADFSNKISIAYKECLETKYWLCLLKDTGLIDQATYVSIFPEADEIAKILFSILKSTRMKQQ